ncbi:orotidine 5'-phosphate decarboxylase [Candidatus Termititenax persephonae]|uniref:Orotidine-5'-phosphate decarboxylase n=1 Tax=Candidatus Termititenax persephonae TaxID=2218525 RepID=A0A388THD4_9BACT|nr:orotidine 5'-phosphate decarboxylase [Candidatus Termititenax persephonae]
MNKFLDKINKRIAERKTFVCVGLDTDIAKIPARFQKSPEPLLEFNKYIIAATQDYAACYKPNLAFYEMHGLSGWQALAATLKCIPPEIPVILDAKRGDIGNTSQAYAQAVFAEFGADAVTLAPYMGEDSITPFLAYKENYSFVLCLTSNQGSQDFQKPDLYKKVAAKIQDWHARYGNCGAVVGATHPQEISGIREIIPEAFLLIPGIGVQGGDLDSTIRAAQNTQNSGFIINSSRGIIYAENPRIEAEKLRDAINQLI